MNLTVEHKIARTATRDTNHHRFVRLVFLLGEKQLMEELDARVVTEGANLLIAQANSPGEFLYRERVEDAWLASPIQAYLDLLLGKGCAKEMVEHLRREKIGF